MESPKLIDLEGSISNPAAKTLYRIFRRPIERLLAVDELNRRNNEFLEERQTRFAEDNFFDAVIKKLEISYAVSREDLEKIPTEGPVVCVANHPFGGLDGIILGSILLSRRKDSRLLANYLLGAFEELKQWMIEVNPFGSRNAAKMNIGPLKTTLRWLEGGHCLGTFPAGMVSRFDANKRIVTDREWNANASIIIQRSRATVVPIYFEGRNSLFFQCMGLIHPRLRTALLPRQLVNKAGRKIHVRIGKPIGPQRISKFDSPENLTHFLRLNTYILEKRNDDSDEAPQRKREAATLKERRQPIAERLPVERLLEDIRSLPDSALLFRKGTYSVYGASANDLPNILQEIGRTREETFRPVDEGTGKPIDLDRFDRIYHHLFMWNDETAEIVGAYRYCFVDKVLESHGVQGLYCNTLYEFKRELLDALNPAIEVGRSYVTSKYQRQPSSLALIWRGIGELVARNPQYKILFGAVSMTDTYRSLSKNLMVEYLKTRKLHPTFQDLISARVKPRLDGMRSLKSVAFHSALPELDDISSLVSEVEKDNKGVPVLLKHYLKLNGVILCFGIDQAFSDALDGFIVVDLTKTNPRLLKKYMSEEAYENFARFHEEKSEAQLAAL